MRMSFLLVGLVMVGHADAGLSCNCYGGGASRVCFLVDAATCRADEINTAFNSTALDRCGFNEESLRVRNHTSSCCMPFCCMRSRVRARD